MSVSTTTLTSNFKSVKIEVSILATAIVWALLAAVFSKHGALYNASILMRILASFAGITIGYLAGYGVNKVRLWIKPNFIMTNGGFMSLLWMKIFWEYGPQTIAVLFGWGFGVSMILGK